MKNKPIRSSAAIGRLLDSEGFTDHLANRIEYYWKHTAGLTARQQKQIKRLERVIGEIGVKLNEGERLVLGRFIGLHKKMSFDTGLKIGLAAFAQKLDKDVRSYEEESLKQGSTLSPEAKAESTKDEGIQKEEGLT